MHKYFYKSKLFLILLSLVLGSMILNSTRAKAAGTIFVATTGTNNSTCGTSPNPPCQTVEYAVEQRAQDGDLVSINDGTYAEAQIAVPEGVSLTSTSADNTKVHLRPAATLDGVDFLRLYSATPGSVGNQTISYLEIDGVNGSFYCLNGIKVTNRDNVRIHHNNIHDFKGWGSAYGVSIMSTQLPPNNSRAVPNSYWWEYWPADPQLPGINTNIDELWPTNPVQNLELDNNVIYNCGYKGVVNDFGSGVKLWNLKNSIIHHNDINSGTAGGEAITGTSAFLDNVDIYNNTLTMAVFTDRSSYILELWLFRNGCEIYNNIANAGFSIAYGKELSVYDNTIAFTPPIEWNDQVGNIGLELIGQSECLVYGNYITGTQARGIDVGADGNLNGKNSVVRNITIRNNVLYRPGITGIDVFGGGGIYSGDNTTENVNIYNNVVQGGSSTIPTGYGIRLQQENNIGTGTLRNINVKNNIAIDTAGYAGLTDGIVTNVVIDHNRFNGNAYNSWQYGTATNITTTNPVFSGAEGVNFANYEPNAGSDLIDTGVDVGLSYDGAAPDLGAIETVGEDITTPSTPQGLAVE